MDNNGEGEAREMCCVCGGGTTGAAHFVDGAKLPLLSRLLQALLCVLSPPKLLIARVSEDTCVDKPGADGEAWRGGMCKTVEADWCVQNGDTEDQAGDGTANAKCCVCGGGVRTAATLSPTVAGVIYTAACTSL